MLAGYGNSLYLEEEREPLDLTTVGLGGVFGAF